MRTIRLEAKPDHIMRLAGVRDPVRAVAELIWNGLDAEATSVVVTLEYNDMDGVQVVRIVDDGHGMNSQECAMHFSGLGGSWKSSALVSPNIKRPLHGRKGHGRLRAFALGHEVSWTTVGEAVTGGRQRTEVQGQSARPGNFRIEDAVATADSCGTTFQSNEPTQHVNTLVSSQSQAKLTATFALFLLANPTVEIVYAGTRLDPSKAWVDSAEFQIDIEGDSNPTAELRVIEWRDKVPRSLSLCNSRGIELAQMPPGIQAAGHNFTAYLSWDGFDEHLDIISVADFDEDETLGRVIELAREQLRAYFRDRDTVRRKRQIEQWKMDSVYPYPEEPATPAAAAERGIFDEVATSIARQLPKSTVGKRTTLRLLREVVANDPSDVVDVVEDLFRLTKSEQEDLNRLVRETSLSSIVKATTQVTHRLKFLAGLRALVTEPDIQKIVKERSELHKIIEREVWIFGEQYAPMVSDQGLDVALRRHLNALGHVVDHSSLTPVRREDGKVGIIDLLLGRASRGSHGREHLIVELKAPDVPIGQKEVNQIKSYAEAVVSDPQFASHGVRWDFWVVSTKISSVIREDANSPGRPQGCVSEWSNGVRIWAKTWGDLLDECEARLHYYRDSLNLDASADQGLEHLQRLHGEHLPDKLKTKAGVRR